MFSSSGEGLLGPLERTNRIPVVFLRIPSSEKIPKTVILSILHHHQNPLEPTRLHCELHVVDGMSVARSVQMS
jgi:hypothetical protein